MSYTQKSGGEIRQFYANDRGIGFFYPEPYGAVSGIARIFGLAYRDEGWLEFDRGIARVEVTVGGKAINASLYVKNRYFVTVFDSSEFPDGDTEVTASAWDTDGTCVGTVKQTVTVRNSGRTPERRIFASPCGSPSGDGTREAPYALATALEKLRGGDILFLRGGEYRAEMILTPEMSGSHSRPTYIMSYPGERAEIVGHGITFKKGTHHITLASLHQHGIEQMGDGLTADESVSHIRIWDTVISDNHHPFENGDTYWEDENASGVIIPNLTDDGRRDYSRMRKYIEFSHCLATRNDMFAFLLSHVMHARFCFCEASWCPDSRNPLKRSNYHQLRVANGFTSGNSSYRELGMESTDNAYLFCFSHHNGQDGWDIRTPGNSLFGCVTGCEAAVGIPFGGVGMKFWEHGNRLVNCVNFRNNENDDSGEGMVIPVPDPDADPSKRIYCRKDMLIANCAFYANHYHCIKVWRGVEHLRIENCTFTSSDAVINGNFEDSQHNGFVNNIMYDIADPEFTAGAVETDPRYRDPHLGNFFPEEGSPLLSRGTTEGYTFDIDGIEYARLDGLGRVRNSSNETGPYTRYDRDITEEY